ncbi:hypothetical protein HD806DRAFT_551749 [Xylariaceae sp. AK1471]|nr:hypothetical protein HD806DRAFT_551749 [Xylariaceae sp. AK1471]
MLAGKEGHGTEEERKAEGEAMINRIRQYATDEGGKDPGVDVEDTEEETGTFRQLLKGKGVKPGQRVVYVDGGFDLFSSGHIEFLRQVLLAEEELVRKEGWYEQQAVDERLGKGADYGPVFVVVGVHDDRVINHWKRINYPIMNIYERGLCVLQCRYVNAVIFGAPFTPTQSYLTTLPHGTPDAVCHGPTAFMSLSYDPYTAPKEMGIFRQISVHILRSRDLYEERQRKKGVKAAGEAAQRRREILEEEQRVKEEKMGVSQQP